MAAGTLTGTLTNTATGVVTSIVQTVALPVANANATCEVLLLELGPLDLSLLGLNIHLNEVVLDITASPSGGILGQLLCSLAGGLNISNITNGILAILNQILGQL